MVWEEPVPKSRNQSVIADGFVHDLLVKSKGLPIKRKGRELGERMGWDGEGEEEKENLLNIDQWI